MSLELKLGRRVLYKSLPAAIIELCGHDALMIDLGEAGIVQASRNEVIPIATPEEALGTSDLARIPGAAWSQAEQRACAVRGLLLEKQLTRSRVNDAAEALRISERHLWRLIADYKQHGTVSGLIVSKGGRREGTRVLHPEVERVITEQTDLFYLQPERPTVKSLLERIETECRERQLPGPVYRTVLDRLSAYRDRHSQRRRLGAKAARYQYQAMPGHVRVSAPLERVEIDHTPLDVMVWSDDSLCDYVGRPWLTVAIDVFTRCVLGIHIGFEPPSILSVALCLTHAVLPKTPAEEFGVPLDWPMHGLPKEVMVDNGKDFVSEAFRRGCNEYGILLSFRPVGSPHYGGTIERLIGTLVGQCHLLPGTTKNSTRAKGDYDSAKHAALTLSEVRRWFVEQLLGRYHEREHRALRMPPVVAWQRAMEGHSGS